LIRTIDKLESYAENPMATTVLVVCYKYKTLDKRKKVTKILAKNGVVYESKKLYENQVGEWIKECCLVKICYRTQSICNVSRVLGTDLSKINNELKNSNYITKRSYHFCQRHRGEYRL
jgi:DNA polymerase-3 subunit delta